MQRWPVLLAVLFCVLAASGLASAGGAGEGISFVTAWGSPGSGDGQFRTPNGIAVDDRGDVYVVDSENNRIEKFSATGRFLGKWGRNGGDGSAGSGDGEFNFPYGVAADGWGNVYVADGRNNRIQKFTSDGKFLAKWGRNGGDGSAGTGDGEFNNPRGVTTDVFGNVYVADHGNNRIEKFARDGRFLRKWGRNGGDGSAGSGNGEFDQPRGLAVGARGRIYVAEKRNHRIQELGADGTFLRKWGRNGGDGTPGNGDGEFNLPYGVAVARNGHVFVADTLNNRIQEFTASGQFVAKLGRNGGDGSAGSGTGEFNAVYGIAVDCRSGVYATDDENNRVQRFGAGSTAAARCPPTLTLIGGPARRIRHGRVAISARCDRPCAVRIAITSSARSGRRVRSAPIARTLPPATTVAIAFRVPSRAAKLTLVATASGFGGRSAPVRREVRIAR